MATAPRVGAVTVLQNAVVIAADGVALDISGASNVFVEISGTHTNVAANFEVSIDGGTTWWPVFLADLNNATFTRIKATLSGVNGLYRLEDAAGLSHFRARTTIGAATGTMTVRALAAAW